MPDCASGSSRGRREADPWAGAPPARYFPVEARPLRMRPRLRPFGTPLGNGEVDAHYFQRDREASRYRAARRPDRHRIACERPAERRAHRAVLAFMETTLAREHPAIAPSPGLPDPGRRYATLADRIQEDFVVQLRESDGGDRAIAVYVSFPSGWRPERVLGWSFRRIHAPVPDFADDEAPARSLVSAMTLRGPYLRFVWTVCADDALDHHPDEGSRRRFEADAREGWLRVERQVTVPFPAQQASLFLIRTYLRPFRDLQPRERERLSRALRVMPAATARYKGLAEGRERAIALLAASASPA